MQVTPIRRNTQQKRILIKFLEELGLKSSSDKYEINKSGEV